MLRVVADERDSAELGSGLDEHLPCAWVIVGVRTDGTKG
jgi:hypothetical protein